MEKRILQKIQFTLLNFNSMLDYYFYLHSSEVIYDEWNPKHFDELDRHIIKLIDRLNYIYKNPTKIGLYTDFITEYIRFAIGDEIRDPASFSSYTLTYIYNEYIRNYTETPVFDTISELLDIIEDLNELILEGKYEFDKDNIYPILTVIRMINENYENKIKLIPFFRIRFMLKEIYDDLNTIVISVDSIKNSIDINQLSEISNKINQLYYKNNLNNYDMVTYILYELEKLYNDIYKGYINGKHELDGGYVSKLRRIQSYIQKIKSLLDQYNLIKQSQ